MASRPRLQCRRSRAAVCRAVRTPGTGRSETRAGRRGSILSLHSGSARSRQGNCFTREDGGGKWQRQEGREARVRMKATRGACLFALVAGLMGSCLVEPNEDCWYGLKKGTVVYDGAPQVDGCGWLITVDAQTYHPVNLAEEFQIPDLPVQLCFTEDPEEFRCGRGGRLIPSMRITEMRNVQSAR